MVDGVQFGDLPQFVDFPYLAGVARVNAAALASLARAPSPPAGVRVETLQLENQTTLSWRANPEQDLAGYEIVWRETTAPFWQGAEFVGNVTRASVPMSKDDYLSPYAPSALGAAQPRNLSAHIAQSPGACTKIDLHLQLGRTSGLSALPASAQRDNRCISSGAGRFRRSHFPFRRERLPASRTPS